MKYRFVVTQESRRKAIAFDRNIDRDGNTSRHGITPFAYAQINGFWIDLHNDRSKFRAEFGPFLTLGEAKNTGELLIHTLESGRFTATQE